MVNTLTSSASGTGTSTGMPSTILNVHGHHKGGQETICEKALHRPVGRGAIKIMPDCREPKPKDSSKDGYRKSVIDTIEYSYPLKLMVPRHACSSNCKWIYPISFGGGLVEGDCIDVSVEVGEQCSALLTTQGSTKIYHCIQSQETKQKFHCAVGSDALLALLPEPVVPFKDSLFNNIQTVNMTSSSNLILLDWIAAGRVARKEVWDFTTVSNSYTISIDGETVIREANQLKDTPNLSLRDALHQYYVLGSLVLIGKDLESLMTSVAESYGKAKGIEGTYSCDRMIAYSALDFSPFGIKVRGCMLRFGFPSASDAYKEIASVIQPLFHIFGGNPFENKS